ncbi:hypothetical protein H2201_005947 [Coniosporium apollinis]|uniref:FAD/NAD(P)-binding domain-containing protein n=2 Tax=Coniosporium TaxID=2810619 RepID=A0ABQ9NP11_9PEZI|nr:hypothetical protein H2199_005237 [Cladosporium sp. JES 115]KAJ9662663.1 hypothetical protein H2201_005947 [Coniosporium apollinis]
MGSASEAIPELDVLIVGAGFGAFSTLHKLRQQGLNVKVYEKGSASGGIWYWNQYPGARVDSDTPIYQLFEPELYKDFTFRERYAGWRELKRYFNHVEKKWDIVKDVEYNKNVESATWDESRHQWLVECADGSETYCRWFIPAIGFAAKRYTPPIKGMGEFKGDIYHTAVWPQWGVNLKKKRIAVIGTGASGIQTIQEIGKDASHLTIYQRTPNYCLPMNQKILDEAEEQKKKEAGEYDKAFKKCYTTFAGFTYDFSEKNTFDDTPEEREAFFHKLLIEEGGFHYWLNTYKDMLYDEKANDEAYNYWRNSVLKRVPDPKKAELLAPKNKPHPWGTKRPSLEQNFYEVVSLPHVDIVDLQTSPIEEINETGIKTKDGQVDVDIIILATGFDAVTGSLAQLNIRDTDGKTIKERWADGTRTSMGIAITKFPNLFFLYGPQAPTAFSNGPTCVQVQAEWIDKVVKRLNQDGITRFDAKEEAMQDWQRRMNEKWYNSLFPKAKSWYQGANIPGKKVEPLNWAGGMPAYIETLNKSVENNYQDWNTNAK